MPITRHRTGSLGHWVNGSFGSPFTTGSLGHRVIILTRCQTPVFRFPKKCPKCKTYIWNAEMTKVIVRCLLLDWSHWMSVHAMNFYFYLWWLKILWPENTSSHTSRHLEGATENARPENAGLENDGQLRKESQRLENAGLENDGQHFSKVWAKLRGLENAGLKNDGQHFSKLWAKLRGLENAGLENDGPC